MRTGTSPTGGKFDIRMLATLVAALYQDLKNAHYFDEAFGYVDSFKKVRGTLGTDIGVYVLRRLRKSTLWPINAFHHIYSEDDVFDIVEFFYDCVSKPVSLPTLVIKRQYNAKAGQAYFRAEVNELLQSYSQGYELSEDGQVHVLPEVGLAPLLDTSLPEFDSENVEARVKAAVNKFRNRHSKPDERRDAVRDLADVLEFLRDDITKLALITKKDEGDLFSIANNFAIRHHNDAQQSDYDKEIWYSWMFYFYLATIHTAVRLINKKEAAN